MAVVALCVILALLKIVPETKATTAEMTIPVHPVTVGGVLAMQCEIQNIGDGYKVNILRVIKDRTEQITSGLTYFQSSLHQRVFLAERTMPGGTIMYFMTIVDISLMDSGKYTCKVLDLSTGDYITVAEDSVDIDVYYLPDPLYPQCQIDPERTLNLNENTNIKLSCISSIGNPQVELRWKTSNSLDIVSRNRDQDDTISSELLLRVTDTYDGVIFICEMTSPGFQDFIRTCQVGPITIEKNAKDVNTQADVLPPIVPTLTIKHKTGVSGTCNSECPSEDKFVMLYLSVATIGAGILSLVFLTTTIIWCCKYNKITAQARRSEIQVSPGDGSEPVYVSLQRRPDEERNSTFMTVEDPNNPGNKVLMPKEVMDEFYRSMSLKKV